MAGQQYGRPVWLVVWIGDHVWHVYMCLCVCTCTCVCLCVYMCTHVCACVHVCVHVLCVHVGMCTSAGSDSCLESTPLVPPTLSENPTSPLSPPTSLPLHVEEQVNPDLVAVYADRLCAVTHAFATICTTLQKANGR